MLVLGRKAGESLVFITPHGERIEVQVTEMRGGTVRIGVSAPRDVVVVRKEIERRSQEAVR